MASDGDRILSEDRLRGVLDLFERLRERPKWRLRSGCGRCSCCSVPVAPPPTRPSC